MTKTGDSRAARAPAPKGFLAMPLMTPILATSPRHQLGDRGGGGLIQTM